MRLLIFLIIASESVFGQATEMAKKLYEEKKYTEAETILAPIKEGHREYAASQYYLGRMAFDRKQYERAEDYFEEAIDVNATVAEYHYRHALTLEAIAQNANMFKQIALLSKIRGAFERTVQLDPKNLDAQRELLDIYAETPRAMGGSLVKAEETARAIMKINKAEGFRAMGILYQHQEKLVDAEKQFAQAYQEDPLFAYVLIDFYVEQKKFDQAFAIAEGALKGNPADIVSQYEFGKISGLSGQKLEQGEPYLLKYLSYQPKQNEPSHALANLWLGQIKERSGDKAEAREYYEKSLALNAGVGEAKEGLKRVK